MTSISFTSGQLLDIIALIESREDALYDAGDKHLAAYYMTMSAQFQRVYDRLQDVVPEERVARFVVTHPSSEA